MGVDKLKEDEVGALVNLVFDSTSSPRGGAELFIVAPSVPYVRDAGMTVIKSTPVEEAETVELKFRSNWLYLHLLCEVVYGIIRNLTLPAASGNGPQMSIPHLWNGDEGLIGFSFALGRRGTGMCT
ncbi:hypothetical protein Tco_0066907 [Tanacetum coccineum]